jgi:uncharacterized protein (DUF2336 family)
VGGIDKSPDEALLRSLDEPNWTERAKCAERITAFYCSGTLDAASRGGVEDTFRLLCYDCEPLVRRLLAECLKRATNLPRDIAVTLASDKSEIAVPFIEDSPVLADGDLLAILRDHPGPHRIAVAGRRQLSTQVSDALCRYDDAATIAAILANDGAEISQVALSRLLDRRLPRAIVEAIARRRRLPLTGAKDLRDDDDARRCAADRATGRPTALVAR